MSEHTPESRPRELEERSRALFQSSVDGLDMAMRSRLTRARYAALEAAGPVGHRAWFARIPIWSSAAGVTAAAALGFALWFGSPAGHHAMMSADNPMNLEDLELVASIDENAGDAMEMLQDDIEFYDWADKATSTEPAA